MTRYQRNFEYIGRVAPEIGAISNISAEQLHGAEVTPRHQVTSTIEARTVPSPILKYASTIITHTQIKYRLLLSADNGRRKAQVGLSACRHEIHHQEEPLD